MSNTADPQFAYEIASDFVEAGWSEDGERIIMEVHRIVAERLADGRRWSHDHSMQTRPNWGTPKALLRLLERVQASGINPVGREHWRETRPNYCSEAARSWERMDAVLEKRADLEGC